MSSAKYAQKYFRFCRTPKKSTYGLSYKLTLKRNKGEALLDKAVGYADARVKIDHIQWYVRHYTPSIQQQDILSKQILNKTPTEVR